MLLGAGADINATEIEDETVLTVVLWNIREVTQRHIDTILLLLDRGPTSMPRHLPTDRPPYCHPKESYASIFVLLTLV
jgi:hypothetical protein